MVELVDHNHSLTLTADGKAFCSCGEKFKVDPERAGDTIDAWQKHLEIPGLLDKLKDGVRVERILRLDNEAAIKRLVELGYSSTAISKHIGFDADDKVLMSPSTIQRIAKGEMIHSPRRRRR